MAVYTDVISSITTDINPIGVEFSMLNWYGRLSHLPIEVFREEVERARWMEASTPGWLRGVASGYGTSVLAEFDAWESSNS